MLFRLFQLVLLFLNLYSTQKIFSLHPMSLFSTGSLLICLLLADHARNAEKKYRVAGGICGMLLALLSSLSHYGSFLFSSFGASIFYVFLFTIGLGYAYSIIITFAYSRLASLQLNTSKSAFSSRAIFVSSFLFILIVWSFFFLSCYPGIFNPDSVWQLEQAMGDSPLSNHHPVVHTLLIRGIINLGTLLSSGNMMFATALLSVIQMVFLSVCMAYSVATVYNIGVPLKWCVPIALFYALAPFNIIFSFTNLKDTWFAGFFLVLLSVLLKRIHNEGSYNPSGLDMFLFTVSILGIGLFRSNGFFTIIALSPFFVFFYKRNRSFLIALLACVIICAVILGPVYNSLGVIAVDPVEYLSVPLQQISRVLVDGGYISDSDYALISKVIDPALIPSSYYSRISDNIKNLIRSSGDQQPLKNEKMAYFSLWLRLLKDNPFSYINAYIDLSNGFWYPEQTGVPYVVSMEPNPYDLYSKSLLPDFLSTFAHAWTYSNNQTSFLGIFFSCGLYIWVFLFLFIFSFTKDRRLYIAFLPSLLLWATILLTTPVWSDIRYIHAIVVCIPILFVSVAKER